MTLQIVDHLIIFLAYVLLSCLLLSISIDQNIRRQTGGTCCTHRHHITSTLYVIVCCNENGRILLIGVDEAVFSRF